MKKHTKTVPSWSFGSTGTDRHWSTVHMNEWDGACVEGFDLIREIREGFPEEVVLELGSEG